MRIVILVGLVVVAGCSSDGTGAALTVDGRWSGTITPTSGPSSTMQLTLSQSGTVVTGTGTYDVPSDPPPAILAVTGSVSDTFVTLTIQPEPQQYMGQTIDVNKRPLKFSGRLTAITMVGSMDGFDSLVVANANFTKQ